MHQTLAGRVLAVYEPRRHHTAGAWVARARARGACVQRCLSIGISGKYVAWMQDKPIALSTRSVVRVRGPIQICRLQTDLGDRIAGEPAHPIVDGKAMKIISVVRSFARAGQRFSRLALDRVSWSRCSCVLDRNVVRCGRLVGPGSCFINLLVGLSDRRFVIVAWASRSVPEVSKPRSPLLQRGDAAETKLATARSNPPNCGRCPGKTVIAPCVRSAIFRKWNSLRVMPLLEHESRTLSALTWRPVLPVVERLFAAIADETSA